MKEFDQVIEEDTRFYIELYLPKQGFWSRITSRSFDTRDEALDEMHDMRLERATNKRVVEVYKRTSMVFEPDHNKE